MMHFDVWVMLPDGESELAGELVCSTPDMSGRFDSEFQYERQWIQGRRFALDPISLPVSAQIFRANKLEPPLSVFEDALPDDWGRRIIIRSLRLPRGQQSEPYLLHAVATDGLALGAIRFAHHGTGSPPPPDRKPYALKDLARAAAAFEAGEEAAEDDELRPLLRMGISLGGARPKALFWDERGDWIAKFPSRKDDGNDVAGLEATGLTLAHDANLDVPEHEVFPLGKHRRALLVRRFDILPNHGRAHMISMRTLCKERPGFEVHSYSPLAETVRKASSQPKDAIPRRRHRARQAMGCGERRRGDRR